MLKIERKSKNLEVRFSLKQKGRVLTPSFLIAFGIACCFHLFSLAIFQISPFKIRHAKTIFPPVQVRIEYLPQIDSGVIAELENDHLSKPLIQEPPREKLKINRLKKIEVTKGIAYPKVKKVLAFPFEKQRFDAYIPLFLNLSCLSSKQKLPLTVHLSGFDEMPEIAASSDLSNLFPKEFLDQTLKRKRISFHTKIENRTGKVFWHLPIGESEKKKALRFAEGILYSLQFEKKPEGFISQGSVEIEFLFPEKEP